MPRNFGIREREDFERFWNESGDGHRESNWPIIALVVAVLLIAGIGIALAHDDGRYAASPLKPWFDHLASGKGLCCSDADGTALSDVDWESRDGHYRVRIPDNSGKLGWFDVPDEAVITEPNRAGKTMVWPIRGYIGVDIRCFMSGSMT
jgi:hypothetical protein